MKRIAIFVVACLVSLTARASVTLNLQAFELKLESGQAMPTSGIVLLVASTTDMTFSFQSDMNNNLASLSQGSFLSGDDLILFKWNLTLNNTPGFLLDTTGSLDLSGNWGANDPLQLYWFPTLALNSPTAGSDTQFGQYRTDQALDGSDTGWFTPADSSTIALNLFTMDRGGQSGIDGRATFHTIPEPSTMALVGVGMLSLVALRRRRRT